MAEEAEKKEGESEAQPPKAKSKKLLFIVIGVVLLLVAIGVPAAFLLLGKKESEMEELSADAAKLGTDLIAEGALDEDEAMEGEEALGAIFPLETFVVNLSGGAFIRLQVQLEFKDRDVPERFLSKIVPIRDAVITLLSARTPSDIASVTGKEALRIDLRELVNDQLKREDVKQVYFSQFVVQGG